MSSYSSSSSSHHHHHHHNNSSSSSGIVGLTMGVVSGVTGGISSSVGGITGGGTGQSLSDRVNAARYALAGQGVARTVCKATTEEILAPKKKHLDYLLQCTHEPNVSIPQLANLLIERAHTNSNWVVVFKSLITTHHLMVYGNERFCQYLATSIGSNENNTFHLASSFSDKATPLGLDMSPFVRRYAKYLNHKASSYRAFGVDLARHHNKGSSGGGGSSGASSSSSSLLRQMAGDKILKTLPILQTLVDSLLEFDAHPRDLSNGVITAAFMLLYRDLIRLFAAFNDGIINLLEKFFSFKSKREAREALELYKKFLVRMDRVAEFLKTAEAVGIDKGDIPDLTRAPSSLLEALEAHCLQMEGKDPLLASAVGSGPKIGGTTTSGGFGGKPFCGTPFSSTVIKEETPEEAYKRALEEEAQLLNKYQQQKLQQEQQRQQQQQSSSFSSSSNNKNSTTSSPPSTGEKMTQQLASFDLLTDSSSSSSASGFDGTNTGDLFGATGGQSQMKVAQEILALFESNASSMNHASLAHQQHVQHPSFSGIAGGGGGFFPSPSHHPIGGGGFPPTGTTGGLGMVGGGGTATTMGFPSSNNPFLSSSSMSSPSRQPQIPSLGGTTTTSSFEANFASAFPSNSSSSSSKNVNNKTQFNNSNLTSSSASSKDIKEKERLDAFLSQDFSLLWEDRER